MVINGDKVEKPTREDLTDFINKFLHAIAAATETESKMKRIQQSSWMISDESGSHSEFFERSIFPSDLIFDKYRTSKSKNIILPEEIELINALKKTGISKSFKVSYLPKAIINITEERRISDLCSQLVFNWLKLENPLQFEMSAVSNLVDEFLNAVLDGKIVFRQRLVIDGL
jgi:hypothetical protein